ncbi:MAG: aminomethyl-transferring glycine dehydrogenase [Polyangiaceae bacterium]|nr:aminomethyl-transferring glycine dehydrogenase [Polyangiaceae bacterium]
MPFPFPQSIPHLQPHESFVRRHIGPSPEEQQRMLNALGLPSLEALIAATVPASIRMSRPLHLPQGISEAALLARARELGQKNQLWRSYIGMGYSGTITPPVILRNIVENPGWYTQYTPYQAEIAQGRLEALLNFQTMVIDLTGLPVANASLLDESTAAAEAMHLAYEFKGSDRKKTFFAASSCHPQTIDVLRTRAKAVGLHVEVGDPETVDLAAIGAFGALVQYPTTDGKICSYAPFADKVHAADALFVVAADILALALLVPPGEFGADVAVGSTQRFGVPLGYGGPHAAYFATKNDFVRKLPGRIIGMSEDANGKPALRMALQTREQHIRRERATSNICTAQALLAIVASMYAVYHGPEGIRAIAKSVHKKTCALYESLRLNGGLRISHTAFFDTLRIEAGEDEVSRWMKWADEVWINLRRFSPTSVCITLDETTSENDIADLRSIIGGGLTESCNEAIPKNLRRTSAYLTHPVFRAYHSETEMLRYIRKLESRDLSLAHSMIPLGSCTMKLNATAEMMPITDPEWNGLHPFVPLAQAEGYAELFAELEKSLGEITGFAAVSLQPNAGSQGEYAGLLAIKGYQEVRGEGHRNVCLIPASAHGTNPASAVMAGMDVVVVATDDHGNIDIADLEAKAKAHAGHLSALMVTYPSTHGVFEEQIKRVCAVVHEHGGQVYMDGANMNAQVGLCRPGDIGADVCHLNLHKTFCIPHGGGGPGVGPICVAAHLAEFLPGKPVISPSGSMQVGPVAAAPWGSASILLISWAYIQMMGAEGLVEATRHAILHANYVAHRLAPHFPVVYQGNQGFVAHECILDMRAFKKTVGIEVDDIAKRLMDYGFHAPTMSFPIAGTLMVEPTESESLAELDRFCDAMISIREEIRAIEEGRIPRDDNPLKHAPHTIEACVSSEWTHPYSREVAAFPAPWTRDRKFWPTVGRVNNAFGDRKLVCAAVAGEV